MDQEDRIQAQIKALLDARNALLHQQPSDMVVIAQVTELIVDLNSRQSALANIQIIPPIDAAAVQALQAAVQSLDNAVRASAAATQILTAATALAKLK